VDFFNDHIVEVRRVWMPYDETVKNAVYDLFCKSIRGKGNLERETSILVPSKLIDFDLTAEEEMELFRQLARDGKITEDMLDSTL